MIYYVLKQDGKYLNILRDGWNYTSDIGSATFWGSKEEIQNTFSNLNAWKIVKVEILIKGEE